MTNNKPIAVNYSDEKLRILVEEHITMQRSVFSLNGVFSYILYWAIEDGRVSIESDSLIESNELHQCDKNRVKRIVEAIIVDGRVELVFGKENQFVKKAS